jgi:RNA polymerase sigma-70 factor (ECF subfamily)
VSLEELQSGSGDGGWWGPPLPSWPAEQESSLVERERHRRVRALVDRLPDAYRSVILLRDLEELTTGEAAAALQLSEGALKVRLHRAHQALRALVEPEFRPPVHPRRPGVVAASA